MVCLYYMITWTPFYTVAEAHNLDIITHYAYYDVHSIDYI